MTTSGNGSLLVADCIGKVRYYFSCDEVWGYLRILSLYRFNKSGRWGGEACHSKSAASITSQQQISRLRALLSFIWVSERPANTLSLFNLATKDRLSS